jgi:hypothetical protein
MADITIYKPAGLVIDIIEGVPPTDQSAEIAALQAQVASLNAKIDAARAAAQAAKDADAATVDGQAVLDALA